MDKVSNELLSINFDDLNSLLGSNDDLEFNLNTDYSDLSSLDPSNDVINYFDESVYDIDLSDLENLNQDNFFNNQDNSNEFNQITEYPSVFNNEQQNDNLQTDVINLNDFIKPYNENNTQNTNEQFDDYKKQLDLLLKNINTQPKIDTSYMKDIANFQKQMSQNYYNLALNQFNEKKREFNEMLKLQQQLIEQKNQEIQLGWQYYNIAKQQWEMKLKEIQHLQQVRQINNQRFLSED